MPDSITNIFRDDLAVIVPAHNEEGQIESLLRKLQPRCGHVVVIDDGSTDLTGDIAEKFGVTVIRNPVRTGKGASIRAGMIWAQNQPVEWVAVMDGDNQHSIEDLIRLAAFAKESGIDLAIGQRDFASGMPLIRRLTNVAMSATLRFLTGRTIPDSQCGLRVLPKSASNLLIPTSSGYEVESELIIRASRLGMKIGLLPIETIYPDGGRSSISPIRDGWRWIRFIIGMAK